MHNGRKLCSTTQTGFSIPRLFMTIWLPLVELTSYPYAFVTHMAPPPSAVAAASNTSIGIAVGSSCARLLPHVKRAQSSQPPRVHRRRNSYKCVHRLHKGQDTACRSEDSCMVHA